jgi:hypothetical protein
MYGFREFCDSGGVLCYGTNLLDQWRRCGYFMHKIFKGTKPGDISIEEPSVSFGGPKLLARVTGNNADAARA